MEREKKELEENVIPLFAIPNVVLFPKTRAPFIVSDDRYRMLVFEAVARSKIVGIFSITKEERENSVKIYPIGCAGKIISVSELSSNLLSIVVEGLFRVKMIDILRGEHYNSVRFEVLPEIIPDEKDQDELKRELMETAVRFLIKIGESKERIFEISQIASNMGLEEVLNWAIFLHPMKFAVKLSLMAEDDLKTRAKRYIEEVNKDIFFLDLIAEYRNQMPKDPRLN